MKVELNILIIFSLLILNSCTNNQHNITVTGRVLDSETKKPIPNAEVVALCWYQINIDDATFKKKKTSTDKLGHYRFTFDVGYKVDIASKSPKHYPHRIYNELSNNTLNVDFTLDSMRSDTSLIVHLTTMDYPENEETMPFIRQRIYSNSETEGLDFSNIEIWGYDFINSKNSPTNYNVDIWLKSVAKEEYPTTLLTSSKGGLIPILNKDIKSSLLFEKQVAPLEGYFTEYKLQGNEEGFFVKCRDGLTYAKILMEKSKIEISSPYKNGYYKEWGYNFGAIYQKDSSRTFHYYMDIDLESFLVDYIYK